MLTSPAQIVLRKTDEVSAQGRNFTVQTEHVPTQNGTESTTRSTLAEVTCRRALRRRWLRYIAVLWDATARPRRVLGSVLVCHRPVAGRSALALTRSRRGKKPLWIFPSAFLRGLPEGQLLSLRRKPASSSNASSRAVERIRRALAPPSCGRSSSTPSTASIGRTFESSIGRADSCHTPTSWPGLRRLQ